MDLLRATSPSVSTSSSLDSNGLPLCRIRCNKSQILVGKEKYRSATDALVAYLNQFDLNEGQGHQTTPPNSHWHLDDYGGRGVGKSLSSASTTTGISNGHKTSGDADTGVEMSTGGNVVIGPGLVVGSNGVLHLEDGKEDVEKLLTSKVSPELKEEVTDTLREVKLRHLLKKAAMKSQKQTKTGLQQEVEAALARSAKLLEKVTRDDILSSKAAVNDISFSTQALLTAANGSSDDSILSLESLELRERENGRVYPSLHSTLKTNDQSSISSPILLPSSPSRHLKHRPRRGSIDGLFPSSSDMMSPQQRVPSSGSSNSLSNNSDPSDIIRRIRSRSVPPRLHKQLDQDSTRDWLSHLDDSISKCVPSWVKNMSPSEISDSAWLPQPMSDRKPSVPSWVEDVGKSEISVDVSPYDSFSDVPVMSRRKATGYAKHSSTISQRVQDLNIGPTQLRPQLGHSTFGSAALSPSLNGAKHVTFGDSDLPLGTANPFHSTPISKNPRRNEERYAVRSLSPSKVLDSEFNGESVLRNNILPQTKRLKKSMENFASSTESLRKSPSSNSSDASSDHRCSSLDTFTLLTGKTVSKADLHKQRSSGNGFFPDSLGISSILPDGSQGHLSNGHSSSDGLDGDRPWEALTNTFKPPVPMGREVETGQAIADISAGDVRLQQHLSTLSLTGGNQPGSMEALKNMLFRLQAEEKCVQEEDADANANSNANHDALPSSSPAVIPALQDYDFQLEPGGHSLEKALLHLNRLKTLVKSTAVTSKSNTDSPTTPSSSPRERENRIDEKLEREPPVVGIASS